jgi:Dolichyl-phosphate-mannose-protein mannosyltransferase
VQSFTHLGGSRPQPVDAERADIPTGRDPRIAALARWPVLAIAAGVGLVLLLTSGRVGYVADELYFLAAGRHLDWGYADQGPLVPLLVRAMDIVFPDSIVGERLPATVLPAVGVVVAALIARELGGWRRAQVLTAGTYGMATIADQGAGGHLLSTGTVDVVMWMVTTWLLVRWVRLRDDRLLLWLGVVTAIALQNKWLIVAYWGVVALSVLAVGPRELLRRPLLWLGAALVVLTTLPSLLWQADHGWPQFAMTQVVANDNVFGGRWTFLPLMLTTSGVGVGLALFCYGLFRLLRSPELRSYRFLGWTFVGLVVLFLITGGRFYYVAGFVAPLLATGAVELQRREPARWWRWAFTWPVLVLSAVTALITLPVLPLEWPTPARGISRATLGWPELTDTVADAYRALPPVTRRTTAVVAQSYWDASALDRYGPARGLPHPFSPHRGYWYFGVPAQDADTVLFIGSDPTYLRRYFTEIRQVATVTTGPVMTFTSLATPVWVCTGRRVPWSQLWPQLRHL